MVEEKKIYWVDNLRFLATISVIFLHVASPIYFQFGKVSDAYWWTAFLYSGTTRFGVPIFLMLTGALILPKNYSIGYYLKNRFNRIVLPFLFWSFIYITYNYSNVFSNENITFSTKLTIVLNQLNNGSQYHLWYIYVLIGLYLFIPIISRWVRNATKNEILYFIIIWFFVMILNQPYVISLGIKPTIDFTYFSGFMGYLVLGYYLSIVEINKKWINILPIGLIVLGMAITMYGTYYVTFSEGKSSEVFLGVLSPNRVLFAAGLFLFFKNRNKTYPKIQPIINFIIKFSFGIYLSHVFVINILLDLGISCYTINPYIGIPLTSILTIIISGLLTFGINKLPFGKHFSG